MKPEKLVESRAHRILRDLEHYRGLSSANEPSYIGAIAIQESEKPIGIYENSPGQIENAVVITTFGVHVLIDEEWRFIGFDQLDHVEIPGHEPKHVAETLELHLKSGKVVEISIRGGQGRFRDIWAFVRFFDRVVEDVQKSTS